MSLFKAGSTSQSTIGEEHVVPAPTRSNSIRTGDATSEFTFTLDPAVTSSWPKWPPPTTKTTTRPTPQLLSDRSETQTTARPGLFSSGIFGNASSVTLRDEFPWHEVHVKKNPQRMPPTICPALLLPATDFVPPSTKAVSRDNDTDSDASDLEDALPRYTAVQKAKSKAQQDSDIVRGGEGCGVRLPLQFPVGNGGVAVPEWVVHNRPLLRDYADRPTSLPLGTRLEVSIDEPSKFILGALHLLVNRDNPNVCVDPSRRIGPQLIENFVDLDRWAKEYFRSRHSAQTVDSDITTLLTIVMNSFFEGQVQLIDQLVESAFKNMKISGRSSLALQDFAFGFDFRMSHDLPFYVETSSRLRKPLPFRAMEMPLNPEPVTTISGRQVKPSQRAQEAAEQAQKTSTNTSVRRDKERKTNTSRSRGRRAGSGSARKKRTTQPAGDPTVQDMTTAHFSGAASPVPNMITTAEHTRYQPTRPSNLREPPVLPDPASENASSPQAGGKSKSVTAEILDSASTDNPNANASDSGPSQQPAQLPRLKIKLCAPGKSLPASTTAAPVIRDSGSTSSNDTNNACTGTEGVETTMLRAGDAWRAQVESSRPQDLPLDRCGSGASSLSITTGTAAPDDTTAQTDQVPSVGADTDDAVTPVSANFHGCVQSGDELERDADTDTNKDTGTTTLTSTASTPAGSGERSHAAVGDDALDAQSDGRVPRQGPARTENPKRKRPATPPSIDPKHPRQTKKRKLNDGAERG